MTQFITTLGPKSMPESGYVLPHEHIFADFLRGDDAGKNPAEVLRGIRPYVERAQRRGLTALVDATSIGGARRIDILQALSQAVDLPIIVATGIFKDPPMREWTQQMGRDGLTEWMLAELRAGIEDTNVCAGWIKLSVSDDGVTDYQRTLLEAAALASRETNATIGSHTTSGELALAQLDIIEKAGGDARRFIWVHTQTEPDFSYHLKVARRGAWLEYDNIGVSPDDETYVDWIIDMIEAGFEEQILLSHDCGGYDPGAENGGAIAGYTYLVERFLPCLRARGVNGETIDRLIRVNPFAAYAR